MSAPPIITDEAADGQRSRSGSASGAAPLSSVKRQEIVQRKTQSPLYYADYLALPKILNAQHPLAGESSLQAEHLFITTHQAYELWFKQILLEIDSVRNIFSRNPVEEAAMGEAVHRLQRVREIQNVLLAQIPVLETMTPIEFLEFRDALYPASGFQSAQFRLVENKLGLPASARLSYGLRGYCTYLNEADAETVKAAEAEASLHDLVNAWLERTPFLALGSFSFWEHYRVAVTAMLDEDERVIRSNAHLQGSPDLILQQVSELTKQREHFSSLFDESKYAACVARGERRMSYKAMQAALLITLYNDQPMLTLPYRLLQCLVDLDENFTLWRYRHALMVHRMLGSKVGTGGSSGYHYLRATAERHKIFVDLTDLPTYLIPRYMMPPLPKEVSSSLNFTFSAAGAGAGAGSATGPAFDTRAYCTDRYQSSGPVNHSHPHPSANAPSKGEQVIAPSAVLSAPASLAATTAGVAPNGHPTGGGDASKCPMAHLHGSK